MTWRKWGLVGVVIAAEFSAVLLSKILFDKFKYGFAFLVCFTGALVLFKRPQYGKITLGFMGCYFLSQIMPGDWEHVYWSYAALWGMSLFWGSYSRYSLENIIGAMSLFHVGFALAVTQVYGQNATLATPGVYDLVRFMDWVLLFQNFVFCGYVLKNTNTDSRPANIIELGQINAREKEEKSHAIGAH